MPETKQPKPISEREHRERFVIKEEDIVAIPKDAPTPARPEIPDHIKERQRQQVRASLP
jgi:hypothetical protein